MFHVDFSYALNSLIIFLQFSLDQKISRGLLKKTKNVERSKISKTIFFLPKFRAIQIFLQFQTLSVPLTIIHTNIKHLQQIYTYILTC